jgi:hypothetical protein
MSAILEGISDEQPGQDEASPEITRNETSEQGGDDTFLISDDEIQEPADGKFHPDEGGTDGSFLIGDEEAADEIPDEVPEKVSADKDFIEDMIAADEFVIQDELLYEDKSLKKNQKIEKKPDDK